MGTSTSSSGGKAGCPFDPEWLPTEAQGDCDDAGDSDTDDNGAGEHSDDDGSSSPSQEENNREDAEFAPPRRFAAARTKIAAYLAGGGRESLHAAIKSMVNKGMGGRRRAAATMRGTAKAAGTLGQFLANARDQSDLHVKDWVARVRQANMSADDLILELVKEVLPGTGSADDESLRNAAADALGQLYELDPNMDIFALTDLQIFDVMAITIANDVCNRMDMQLGQTYERLKYTPQQIQLYRKDMREYVQAESRVAMERLGTSALDLQRLAQDVLKSTLEVFAS